MKVSSRWWLVNFVFLRKFFPEENTLARCTYVMLVFASWRRGGGGGGGGGGKFIQGGGSSLCPSICVSKI